MAFAMVFPIWLGIVGALDAQEAASALGAEGELGARIALVFDRFYRVAEPAFTDDFILADVKLDPAYPRRFDEFSGDISGRFIGAVAMMSRGEADDALLHRLVSQLLPCQRPDGRFGNAALSFTAADVDMAQMALLWGNGRLLVGLLEYHQRFPERAEALAAAVRLGDFLLGVFDECATPAVMERVRGKAANGFICFTQFNEGLELLARATGETRYRDAARKMEPLLEARGAQHTHGYLTTLRGHLMIHESTGAPDLLAAVEARYQDLLASGSVMINGGLLEYFKPDYNRDEGCSEADFLRLCLQLHKATGKEEYLTQAEACLHNIFYANQFETGDFGHRCFDARGYVPHPGAGRAWWCCTMHGLRAFRDALDAVVVHPAPEAPFALNLWMEGKWTVDGMTLSIARIYADENPAGLSFRVTAESVPETAGNILLRRPGWASAMRVTGAAPVSADDAAPIAINGLAAGASFDVHIECALRFVDRKNQAFTAGELPEDSPAEMAIFYGPWLMGVDSYWNPMFHGEPYSDNCLLIPGGGIGAMRVLYDKEPMSPILSGPRVCVRYRHGGFPDLYTVILQPISDQTMHMQSTVSYWHRVQRIP